ncbi:hypothetical protein [Halarsenatibacter silvermanii]|uniref:Uncharacterized protein n=1 Tax=Halarsenatibacter silvermanii TaxID=321763 RepID=A0A1G9MEG4_9FIRM|nr:hypothetical protein [Halarsenatibacter silvermanii]SDL72656.1 hypothetical protein SAMN04488692_10844 [Halarsenatibacter silvermanii]
MEVYINGEKQPEDRFSQLSGQEIIGRIRENWPDSLIEKILLEEEEVPLIYFQEKLEKDEQFRKEGEVEFVLCEKQELMEREIERIEDYLPRLEATIEEMVDFLSGEKKEKARSRYRSALEGLEWMQSKLVKVMRVKEDKEQKLKFQDERREYHRAIKSALVAYQQGRDGRLSQLFSEEILFYLKNMIAIVKEEES